MRSKLWMTSLSPSTRVNLSLSSVPQALERALSSIFLAEWITPRQANTSSLETMSPNTNPKKGPFHHVAPSRIMWRTIRGMLPYKTAKGEAALGRLKCFDGCPVSVNAKKKMVIPEALKAVRLQPRAKYSVLGNIAKECGWTKQDLISTVEAKRIGRNHEWYKKKVDNLKKEKEVIKNNKEVQDVNKQLEEYGY